MSERPDEEGMIGDDQVMTGIKGLRAGIEVARRCPIRTVIPAPPMHDRNLANPTTPPIILDFLRIDANGPVERVILSEKSGVIGLRTLLRDSDEKLIPAPDAGGIICKTMAANEKRRPPALDGASHDEALKLLEIILRPPNDEADIERRKDVADFAREFISKRMTHPNLRKMKLSAGTPFAPPQFLSPSGWPNGDARTKMAVELNSILKAIGFDGWILRAGTTGNEIHCAPVILRLDAPPDESGHRRIERETGIRRIADALRAIGWKEKQP